MLQRAIQLLYIQCHPSKHNEFGGKSIAWCQHRYHAFILLYSQIHCAGITAHAFSKGSMLAQDAHEVVRFYTGRQVRVAIISLQPQPPSKGCVRWSLYIPLSTKQG